MEHMCSVKADIICLQECGIENLSGIKEWQKGVAVWAPSSTSRSEGVGVLINNPNLKVMSYEEVIPGRCLSVILDYLGEQLRVINCYAPTDKNARKEFLKVLRLYLPGRVATVVAGDFNCVRRKNERQGAGGEGSVDITSKILNDLVSDFRMKDAAMEKEKSKVSHTFFSDKGTVSSRIDFLFLSEFLEVEEYMVTPVLFSDHKMISCKLDLGVGVKFGPGVWKLNVSVLEEEEVIQQLYIYWDEVVARKLEFPNVLQWWDWAKKRLTVFFQRVCRVRAAEKKWSDERLIQRLHFLYKCQRCGVEVSKELEEVKEERTKMLKEKGKSIIFNAKVREMEEGEQCTRFFFKKVFSNNKVMRSVMSGDEEVEGGKMMEEVVNFYRNLYGAQKEVPKKELTEYCAVVGKGVCEEEMQCLCDPVSEKEIEDVLGCMQKNKTPGKDGLPVEVYVKLWPVLKEHLVEVVKYCVNEGTVSPSMREGVITLIFKKGDRKDIKNWRPITLLNADYKLVAKVLASRLSRVVGKMLGDSQVCAVPGRRISDILVLLRDLVSYVQMNNMPLALMGIDLEKAYDKVSHTYLFRVLTEMGLPEPFLKTLKGLYCGIKSQVLVNGTLSETFSVLSGVRQGCPLSPLMFVFAIEPLLQHVQNDKCFKGIFVPGSDGSHVKSVGYMDDITFVCSSVKDAKRAELQLSLFGSMSGLNVNWQKSQICTMSGTCNLEEVKVKKTESLVILGTHFERNLLNQKNAEKMLEKVSKKVEFWKLRRLTLTGKVLIVKSVILPLLLYFGSAFPPGVKWTQKITRVLFVFFWGSRMERLQRKTVQMSPEHGGYGFPDIGIFMTMHLWLTHYKVFVAGGLKAHLMRYLAGWSLVKWGWCGRDLLKPTALVSPLVYRQLNEFFKKFKLSELGVGAVEKTTLVKWLRKEEVRANIFGLGPRHTDNCWKKVFIKGVSNRQKEITWMAFHGVLLTKNFLKARDLARDEICPREGCNEIEVAQHALFSCVFAKKVRQKLIPFMENVVEVKGVSILIWFFGLFESDKIKERKLWIMVSILKEVLWDARCWEVRRKCTLSVEDCTNLFFSRLYVVLLVDRRWMGKVEADMYWGWGRWKGGGGWG